MCRSCPDDVYPSYRMAEYDDPTIFPPIVDGLPTWDSEPPHPFEAGGVCMSKCRCGRTFSDPLHGEQPREVAARLRPYIDMIDVVDPKQAPSWDSTEKVR